MGTTLSRKLSPLPRKTNEGSTMTQWYTPILSVDSHECGQAGVAVVEFEGRKGNTPLYFHSRSDVNAGSDPAGPGPGCGDVVH